MSRRSVERASERQPAAKEDQVSRAGSSISKHVAESNKLADVEIKSKLGLSQIQKTRPEDVKVPAGSDEQAMHQFF